MSCDSHPSSATQDPATRRLAEAIEFVQQEKAWLEQQVSSPYGSQSSRGSEYSVGRMSAFADLLDYLRVGENCMG